MEVYLYPSSAFPVGCFDSWWQRCSLEYCVHTVMVLPNTSGHLTLDFLHSPLCWSLLVQLSPLGSQTSPCAQIRTYKTNVSLQPLKDVVMELKRKEGFVFLALVLGLKNESFSSNSTSFFHQKFPFCGWL